MAAQVEGMLQAWEWRDDDRVLHVLPLHHVHGIVNVLVTPLTCGAQCYMLPKFDAKQVNTVVIRGNVPQGAGFYTRYDVYVIQWLFMSLGQLDS